MELGRVVRNLGFLGQDPTTSGAQEGKEPGCKRGGGGSASSRDSQGEPDPGGGQRSNRAWPQGAGWLSPAEEQQWVDLEEATQEGTGGRRRHASSPFCTPQHWLLQVSQAPRGWVCLSALPTPSCLLSSQGAVLSARDKSAQTPALGDLTMTPARLKVRFLGWPSPPSCACLRKHNATGKLAVFSNLYATSNSRPLAYFPKSMSFKGLTIGICISWHLLSQ